MSDQLILRRELEDKILEYVGAGRSDRTKSEYASDWRQIAAYCEEHNYDPMPMAPEVASAVIIWTVEQGRSLSTLLRRIATISAAHRVAGAPSPLEVEGVRLVLRGAKRRLRDAGKAERKGKKPLMVSDLLAILATMGKERAKDIRDRAVLLVGWSAALRRSEIVGLDVSDIQSDPRGILLRLRFSKTDKEGLGQHVPIRQRERYCPVAALDAWLEICGRPVDGPVFRTIQNGVIKSSRMDGRDIARLVKSHVARIGLDPSGYAGHSLRSGLVVSAREGGAGEAAIMRITRHESVSGLMPYLRKGDLWKEDPAGIAGLR